MRHEKNLLHILCYLLLLVFLVAFAIPSVGLAADGPIVGLDTNGATFEFNPKTGAATPKTNEPFNAFSLGGTARRDGKFYYVVEPSGLTDNAIYTVVLKTSAISHVALDRDDPVRAMFFKGKKLFGVFYNGNTGLAGVYKINPVTGATTQVLDLSALDIEPITGAIAELNGFYYMLVKPEIDSTRRQLLRFKTKANSASVTEVVDASNVPVLCERLEPNFKKNNFVCMASAAAETQVNVCKLTLKGKATCTATLPNILRIGGGHTMLSADGKSYYAFVYAPGEENNQRLIKFTSKGVIKSNLVLSTILIGAHFKNEPVPPED